MMARTQRTQRTNATRQPRKARRNGWKTVEYTITDGTSADQITRDALWSYGIDTVLVKAKRTKIGMKVVQRVPAPMHWMADHLLRKYALSTESFVVDSRPVVRDGKSSADNVTAKMWKPWGVMPKARTFNGRLIRAIGGALGRNMSDSYNRIEGINERT